MGNPRYFWLNCHCRLPDHTLRLSFDDPIDKRYPELFVHFYLAPVYPFPFRLWQALKYAFGYRSKYGDWDEIVLEPDSIFELVDYLGEFLQQVGRLTAPTEAVSIGSSNSNIGWSSNFQIDWDATNSIPESRREHGEEQEVDQESD